jgi:hypothetical protein
MNKEFTKALSLEEIKTTISAMPKGKMPGKEGFPTQFFQENLEQVGAHTLANILGNVILEIKINGEIGATFNLHK